MASFLHRGAIGCLGLGIAVSRRTAIAEEPAHQGVIDPDHPTWGKKNDDQQEGPQHHLPDVRGEGRRIGPHQFVGQRPDEGASNLAGTTKNRDEDHLARADPPGVIRCDDPLDRRQEDAADATKAGRKDVADEERTPR